MPLPFLDSAFLPDLMAFGSVVLIDLTLAGDNAIVVGMVASRLPPTHRRRVIALGIGIAMAARIGFALVAVQLLALIGLLFAGGLLLLWVAWKMWRELQSAPNVFPDGNASGSVKGYRAALWQIVVADISMSLDNVLAVAGAARGHTWMLIFGLVLSIALMGVAATLIARYMTTHRWLGFLGLGIVAYVATSMIYDGGMVLFGALMGKG